MATPIIQLKNCIKDPATFGLANWIIEECMKNFSKEIDKISNFDELIIDMEGLNHWELYVDDVFQTIIQIINTKRPSSRLIFANIPVFAYEYMLNKKASNVIQTVQWL